MKRTFHTAILRYLLAALTWPISVQATSLDLASFGSFQNIATGPEASQWLQNNDQVTDALLLWGDASASYSSRLGFNGLGSTHKPAYSSAEVGTAFQIGEFSYLNGTPGGNEINANTLELLLSIQFAGVTLSDFVFGIQIDNTGDENTKGVADHLQLLYDFGIGSSYRFTLAGQDYSLNFLGLSTDQGASYANGLSLAEGEKLKVGLYAIIQPASPQPVPAPASVWLFGSGLMALTGLYRRR